MVNERNKTKENHVIIYMFTKSHLSVYCRKKL